MREVFFIVTETTEQTMGTGITFQTDDLRAAGTNLEALKESYREEGFCIYGMPAMAKLEFLELRLVCEFEDNQWREREGLSE